MSALLPSIDLTSAAVGTQKNLDFNSFTKFNPANMQQKAHLGLFNESGCGLQCVMQASGDSQYLPAGGWTTFEIEPNDSSMTATVTYTLPNPPVSQLNAVYYAPGETIPESYTLGNSPIGIGGTVQTSSVQTLSNEGQAAGTQVVDIGDTALSQLMTFFTDHFVLKVDQAGVAHTVLTGSTTGNPAQIGQAGDTSGVLGSFTVGQRMAIAANVNSTIQLMIGTQADNHKGLEIFAQNATQTADLLQCTDNLFNPLFQVLAGGGIKANQGATVANGLTTDSATVTSLLPNSASTQIAGGSSGTATLYSVMTGTIKMYLLILNNFKTGVSAQTIALPTAFTTGSIWFVTDSPGYNLVSSGVNQTMSFMTTTQNSTTSTTGQSWNIASLLHAWDTIQWSGGNASAHNGFFFFIGV